MDAQEGLGLQTSSGITKSDWGFPAKDTEYVVIDTKFEPLPVDDIGGLTNNYELISNVDGVLLYQLCK